MKAMANASYLSRRLCTPIECFACAELADFGGLITGVASMEILDQACEAARTFRPLTIRS